MHCFWAEEGGDQRPLFSGGVSAPHQSIGAESRSLGVESLPTIHQRKTGPGVHGQHRRHVVLQQAGRGGLVDTVTGGSVPLDMAGT